MKKMLLAILLSAFCGLSFAAIMPIQKAEMDWDTVMKMVDQVPPGPDGWRMLAVPAKDYEQSGIRFLFCKSTNTENWGYGMVSPRGAITIVYDVQTDQTFYSYMGQITPISKEVALKSQTDFMILANQYGDFEKAHPFVRDIDGVSGGEKI